jgi:DNA-binding NtrC family response regulator
MRGVIEHTLDEYIQHSTRRYLARVLRQAQGSATAAARSLRCNRVHLLSVIARHGLTTRGHHSSQVSVREAPFTLARYRSALIRRYLTRVLAHTQGHVTNAAKIANRSRTTFNSLVLRYEIPHRRANKGAWDRPLPGYDECELRTPTAEAHTSG